MGAGRESTESESIKRESCKPSSSPRGKPSTTKQIKQEILEAVSNVQSSSTIAEQPPAGLFVTDVGTISMPLTKHRAKQLIERCRQAPYGRKSETIVDTSVRNTWELDATQLGFKNPAWPAFIEGICDEVAKGLGIDSPIKAEIYKMLIYERGAMFKPHTE